MTQTTCKNCGNTYDSPVGCPHCGQTVAFEAQAARTPKAERVLAARLSSKKMEFDNANGYGPTMCVIVGLLFTIALIGIPLIVVGAIWANNNATTRMRVTVELTELEE